MSTMYREIIYSLCVYDTPSAAPTFKMMTVDFEKSAAKRFQLNRLMGACKQVNIVFVNTILT